MSDVTQILSAIENGEANAVSELLPLVYDELRNLAAAKLAQEKPGQTLQATALVHEVYIRLAGDSQQSWSSRGHFFGAAAEAMRRILVERARQKRSLKRGGGHVRQRLADEEIVAAEVGENILAIHDGLDRLAEADRSAAELVKLRYFAGLTGEEAALVLGIAPRTADRIWVYARTFLLREIETHQ